MNQGCADVKSQGMTRVRLPQIEECQELFEPMGIQEETWDIFSPRASRTKSTNTLTLDLQTLELGENK